MITESIHYFYDRTPSMTRPLRSKLGTIALVFLSACDFLKPIEPIPEPIPPPTPDVTDRDGDGVADSNDRCPTQPETRNNVFDLDGCPDTPQDLYVAVRADVEAFWSQYFTSVLRRPYSPLQGVVSFTGTATSLCGPGQGPFYCPASRTMYLDLNFLSVQLTRIGDFAPAIIIAHEVGHHTQALLGFLGNGALSIQTELQADCLAGRWAASAGARGLLDAGDVQEAFVSLFTVGDPAGTPWFAPGAHGTAQQRQAAFSHGLANGAC
jgi:uncharacterized protein